jgi:DNA-binding NarL/FixJ family response regulator
VTIRVVVADDQGMVRSGFSVLLNAQPDIEVIAEAVNGQEAIAQAAALHPDVILMDVRMPVLDGLQATREITAMPDPPKILVLTTFDLDDYVYEALRSGASGFLLKDASAGELADAVRKVAAGDALLAPGVTRRLIAEFARMGAPRSPSRKQVEGLTERESEVLALVARGMSNSEIAGHLIVAEQNIRPTAAALRVNGLAGDRGQATARAAAGIAATTAGGVLFSWLRSRSGSLTAPMLLHLTTNCVGPVVAWAVAPDRVYPLACGRPKPVRLAHRVIER